MSANVSRNRVYWCIGRIAVVVAILVALSATSSDDPPKVTPARPPGSDVGHGSPASSPRGARNSAASLDAVAAPLVPNAGQFDPRVRYGLRDRNVGIYFTSTGFTLSIRAARLGVALASEFVGGRAVEPVALGEGQALVHSFVGALERWREGLRAVTGLVYPEVWDGVDVRYEPRPRGLEYTLVLRPGSRLEDVRLRYQGVEALELEPSGGLRLRTALGVIPESRPRAFQSGREVAVRFRLHGGTTYGFEVDDYDPGRELIIDPVLSYASYLGGGNGSTASGFVDRGRGMAVDASGNIYLTGETTSDFPVMPGGFDVTHNGDTDVFVVRLKPDGSGLDWATFLGAQGTDAGCALAVDAMGNVFVAGNTSSTFFPTTPGVFGPNPGTSNASRGFVARLAAGGGALLWSGLVTPQLYSSCNAVALDPSGDVIVAGETYEGLQATPGAFDESYNGGTDAYVAKVSGDGTMLKWATHLGGTSHDHLHGLVVDPSGNATVVGETVSTDFPTTPGAYDNARDTTSNNFDVFVARVASDGASLVWSTYLGGSGSESGRAVALDAQGYVYVAGSARLDFPTTPGAYDTSTNWGDAFVAKLAPDGASLEWSTVLGGSGDEEALALAVDDGGNAYVAGVTLSQDFPVTAGAYDVTSEVSGMGPWIARDAFVARIDAGGAALGWATYLGGASQEEAVSIAVDDFGNVTVLGTTESPEFPVTPGVFDGRHHGGPDVFVTRILAGGASLGWSTFLGGRSADHPAALAVDAEGNMVVVGATSSHNFPTTLGAFQVSHGGGPLEHTDAFVTWISADGAVGWSTFLGGAGDDAAAAVAFDADGNVLVTGQTDSSDFPATPGSYDSTANGGKDVFVAKIGAGGASLLWATLVGGPGFDAGTALAVAENGDVVVAGHGEEGFPTTAGAYDTAYAGILQAEDGFVARVAADGSSLVWSTFLGGTSVDRVEAVLLAANGDVVAVGATLSRDFPVTAGAYDGTPDDGYYEAFVSRLAPDGSALVASTLLGGPWSDWGRAVTTDSAGRIIVAGDTQGGFPVTPGAYDSAEYGGDGFIACLSPALSALEWSTLLGGEDADFVRAVHVRGDSVYVAGVTSSRSFPTTPDAPYSGMRPLPSGFASRIDSSGTALAWSTYLNPGPAYALKVTGSGEIVIAGVVSFRVLDPTGDAFDPTYNGSSDVYLLRLEEPPAGGGGGGENGRKCGLLGAEWLAVGLLLAWRRRGKWARRG